MIVVHELHNRYVAVGFLAIGLFFCVAPFITTVENGYGRPVSLDRLPQAIFCFLGLLAVAIGIWGWTQHRRIGFVIDARGINLPADDAKTAFVVIPWDEVLGARAAQWKHVDETHSGVIVGLRSGISSLGGKRASWAREHYEALVGKIEWQEFLILESGWEYSRDEVAPLINKCVQDTSARARLGMYAFKGEPPKQIPSPTSKTS